MYAHCEEHPILCCHCMAMCTCNNTCNNKLLVQDELASTIGKVDRVKQLLFFPAVEGYRFRAGSGRVFLGSKDLFVSELAASFHFSCRRAVGSDGRAKVRLSLEPHTLPLHGTSSHMHAGGHPVIHAQPAPAQPLPSGRLLRAPHSTTD